MDDLNLLLFSAALFAAIAVATYVVLATVTQRIQIKQRLKSNVGSESFGTTPADPLSGLAVLNDRLLGSNASRDSQLKLNLIRAGFFSDSAPQLFLLLRTGAILYLPLLGYVAVQFFDPNATSMRSMLVAFVLLLIGFILPGAVLERLKTRKTATYQIVFPDFLDMMVVCVDAGLSFEGAIQRLGTEFSTRSRPFSINLQILSSELRAGRATGDALDGLAERIGMDEARSFATLIKQSMELGSDVGSALRVYSEEMRDKRGMRAEEKANRLPVVMIIPLGLFIFPVIVIVILFPAIVKIAGALQSFNGGG